MLASQDPAYDFLLTDGIYCYYFKLYLFCHGPCLALWCVYIVKFSVTVFESAIFMKITISMIEGWGLSVHCIWMEWFQCGHKLNLCSSWCHVYIIPTHPKCLLLSGITLLVCHTSVRKLWFVFLLTQVMLLWITGRSTCIFCSCYFTWDF